MSQLHDRTFPGESDAYRTARDALLRAEMALREQLEEVAARRRALPLGATVPEDYVFEEIDARSAEAREVRLSELFEDGKDSLIVYSYMYSPAWQHPCPMCTSIIDGLAGTAPHARQRVNLAVVAKAPLERLKPIVETRGWTGLRVLSSARNRYGRDYHAEWQSDHGDQHPMINVFVRRGGAIHHFWASELYFVPWPAQPRHADLIWPLWNLFDLTPEGRGSDWMPKLAYQ